MGRSWIPFPVTIYLNFSIFVKVNNHIFKVLLQKPHPERERLSEGPKNAKIQELPGLPGPHQGP